MARVGDVVRHPGTWPATRLRRRVRGSLFRNVVVDAEKLALPQSFVSKYESGGRRLDAIDLRHVAEAMDTTLTNVVAR